MACCQLSAGPRRRLLQGVGLLLLVMCLVGVWSVANRPSVNLDAVLRANNRGIGHMEQLDFEKAVSAFEEVVRLDSNWLPGQVNLGIALLNTHDDNDREEEGVPVSHPFHLEPRRR